MLEHVLAGKVLTLCRNVLRRAFRRSGTASATRKRARLDMLEHVLVGKVLTLCRNMLLEGTANRLAFYVCGS